MDVLVRMLDHHLKLTGEIIDRLAAVAADALDRPIDLSVEGIDRDPTLRSVSDRLVGQLEMWVAALEGATRIPADRAASPGALRARLDATGPRFREPVVAALAGGRADETLLDATCDPPQTFSYGGMLAHVLTFFRPCAGRWRSERSNAAGSTTSAQATPCASSAAQEQTQRRSAANGKRPLTFVRFHDRRR